LFLFLLAWAFLWYIPIPPRRFSWKTLSRIVSLLIGLFLFFIIQLFETPLSIFVYLLIFLRLFVAFIESAFMLRRVNQENENSTSHYPRPRIPWKASLKIQRKIVGVLFLIYLLSASTMIIFGQIQRVSNAAYFNNNFVKSGSGLPFNGTIPDNMVRLVTEELARSIARRHMSAFGSNMRILDCHITKSPEGKLVWVAAIGSTNVLAENYVKGFVIIDATDPTATPELVQSEFVVGEGLWWDHDIHFRSYMGDMAKSYGVAYATWNMTSNNLAYVLTRYNVGFDLIRTYETPLIYDSQGNTYCETNSSDIPFWITQIYDENWLEGMINEMGCFRRGDGFDYWAGGLLWIIPPSRERFQMTEDTRYVVDPETNDSVALVCVNPVGNQRTLAGVFKATREGVFFYDFKLADYISGMTAEDLVEGRLPKPAMGIYHAEMPLLYPIEISPNNYSLAWYVPIYWREGTYEPDETIYLAGFAIVDASETNNIVITMNGEGLTSEQLVRNTRLDFMKLFGAVTYVKLNATVQNKYEYVEDGTTHIVLQLYNDTYPRVEATPKDIPTAQWDELMATEKSQNVTMHIEKREDRWIMTYFDNLNIS